MTFPGDAYNQFINSVKTDCSNHYSKPNQIEIGNYTLCLVVNFRNQAKTGFLKNYNVD